MMISAALSADVIDTNDSDNRELHLQFTPDFRAMPADHRSVVFKKYVDDLNTMLLEMNDDNTEKAGIITLRRISNKLLPYILRDEIPLSESMVIDVTLEQDAIFNIFSKNDPV